jgi:hypothetical protein
VDLVAANCHWLLFPFHASTARLRWKQFCALPNDPESWRIIQERNGISVSAVGKFEIQNTDGRR